MPRNIAKQNKQAIPRYNPSEIESKWRKIWEETGIYQPDLADAKKPFYDLGMFPYPSAEGLHVGFSFTSAGIDVYGRFKRMQGFDVFEPIGLDGFGIHAENHAIKTGTHPVGHAKRTEKNFYRQLHETGNAYDWSRKVETYDPQYYKWTQWIFTELFKAGLAYRKKSPVNYCPFCKTVLSDEQAIIKIKDPSFAKATAGKQKSKIKTEQGEFIKREIRVCERCDTEIEIRDLEQWFFQITNYAERLLTNIEKLDWTEKIKIAQRNWIGKKEGIVIEYRIENIEHRIKVFTTRPDTNFGATFIALAPEYPFMNELLKQIHSHNNKAEIEDYIETAGNKSEFERQTEGREKTGVFTGLYAVNPLNNYRMPVWVSDFVLSGFGTGALVGVPGHDKRDFEFAEKFGLEVKRVVVGNDGDESPIKNIEQVQEEEGKMVNSGFLNGLDIHEATNKVMDFMEEKGYGERETTYHLRDWLISRQRYWGPPIPMIFCKTCAEKGQSWFTSEDAKKYKELGIRNQESGKEENHNSLFIIHDSNPMAGWFPVEEKDLPVKLPYIEDYKPLGTGKSPLANDREFYNVKCPHCGGEARRETDVSDTFLDSAWYFFRYTSTEHGEVIFDKGIVKKWLPVNMYIGGAEHAVLHLLYTRFITMFFYDLGLIDFDEPFKRFYAHGLIIKDGAKMSKSKGNVINPDDYIAKFGADTLRTYLLFLGPFYEGGDFRDTGIEGMHRFLKRVWVLFAGNKRPHPNPLLKGEGMSKESLKMMHLTIKGVTEDLEQLRFNTAIAKLMTYYNFLVKQEAVQKQEAVTFLKLFAPFAPYMTEELWEKTGEKFSIHTSSWPEYDKALAQEENIIIAVQVNGKLRDTVEVPRGEEQYREKIEELAKNNPSVAKYLAGQMVRKIIYVPGKVLNFVIG